MSLDTSLHGSRIPHAGAIERIALIFVFAYGIYFSLAPWFGAWIVGDDGRYLVNDYLAFWSAGRQALEGHATAAYDPVANKLAQEATLGFSFKGEYPWFYPPFYLFLLLAFALIPFGISYAIWVLLSVALYVRVVGGIVGERLGYLLVLAFPAVFFNGLTGQNGALTAALLGGALSLMQRHPVASGICFGLMTYKPHFGILIPIALVAGQRWRVMGAAAVTAIALALVSWAAFGGAAWTGFLQALSSASRDHITDGAVSWSKMQSFYAVLRISGVGESAALTVHFTLLAAMAVAIAALWRSAHSFNLKAAGLAAGVPLATPYLMAYDGLVLAVALAFLIREGRDTGFRRYEWPAMGVAALMIGVLPFLKFPSIFLAAGLIAALVARRCWSRQPALAAA